MYLLRGTLFQIAALAAAGFLLTAFAFGQEATASISGSVHDPSEAVLVGATVTAVNVDTGFTRTTVTNAIGEYRIPSLPIGAYNVRAAMQGFRTKQQTGIRLEILQVRTVDFSLDI